MQSIDYIFKCVLIKQLWRYLYSFLFFLNLLFEINFKKELSLILDFF